LAALGFCLGGGGGPEPGADQAQAPEGPMLASFTPLGRPLGEGRFGQILEVSLAGEAFALKRFPPAGEDGISSEFLVELLWLRRLAAPCVVRLAQAGFFRGAPFLLLEECGRNLRQEIGEWDRADTPAVLARARDFARQLLGAIGFLRSRGVLHRDIKPDNILLRGGVLKLCDFGLATPDDGRRHESPSYTLPYRPIEQLLGDYRADASSEIWAFGCVVGEMAARGVFFAGLTEAEVLASISAAIPIPNARAWPEGHDLARRRGWALPHGAPKPAVSCTFGSLARAAELALRCRRQERPSPEALLEVIGPN